MAWLAWNTFMASVINMDIVFLTAAYAIFEIAMDESAETMCQLV